MSCCAIGCKNRPSDKQKGLHFYRFPSPKTPFHEERRDRWVQAVRRLDLVGNKVDTARLCSAHFITGEYSLDRNHPDFIPSVFSFTKPRDLQKGQERLKRYKRTIQRIEQTKGVTSVLGMPYYIPEQRALFANSITSQWPSNKNTVPAHTAYVTAVEEKIHGLKRGEIIPFIVDHKKPAPVCEQQDSDEELPKGLPSEGGVHEDHSYSTRPQPPAQSQPNPLLQNPNKQTLVSKPASVSATKDNNRQIRRPPAQRPNLPKPAAKDSDGRKTTISKTFKQKDRKDTPTRPVTKDKPPDACVDEESVSKDHAYAASRSKINQGSARIQCYICNKTVVGVETFRAHISQHLGIKRHICTICDKRFAQKTVLTRHMKIHSSEKPFSCSECGQKFKYRMTYKAHLSLHSGVQYECSHCGKKYNKRASLQSHERNHEDIYRCSICRRCFTSIEIANEHLQIHVKEQEIRGLSGQTSTEDYSAIKLEFISSKMGEFFCPNCGIAFRNEACLKEHVCLQKTLWCTACALSFSCETQHRRHMLEHHKDIAPFHCPFCPRTFRRYLGLRLHYIHHTADRSLLCELCGYRCNRRTQLQVHMRSHTGERPYHCPQCPKQFISSKSLWVHKMTHSTQTYSCSYCPHRTYKNRITLRKHLRNHHKSTGQNHVTKAKMPKLPNPRTSVPTRLKGSRRVPRSARRHACPRSASGSPPSGTSPERRPGGTGPSQLAPLDVKE